jgi:hypothetical protein
VRERIAVICEAEPGLVHVATEALETLMVRAGGRKVAPTNGGDLEYVFRDEHTAREAHPDTMIGRR